MVSDQNLLMQAALKPLPMLAGSIPRLTMLSVRLVVTSVLMVCVVAPALEEGSSGALHLVQQDRQMSV